MEQASEYIQGTSKSGKCPSAEATNLGKCHNPALFLIFDSEISVN